MIRIILSLTYIMACGLIKTSTKDMDYRKEHKHGIKKRLERTEPETASYNGESWDNAGSYRSISS